LIDLGAMMLVFQPASPQLVLASRNLSFKGEIALHKLPLRCQQLSLQFFNLGMVPHSERLKLHLAASVSLVHFLKQLPLTSLKMLQFFQLLVEEAVDAGKLVFQV
jgi:hypothetical protein